MTLCTAVIWHNCVISHKKLIKYVKKKLETEYIKDIAIIEFNGTGTDNKTHFTFS